MQKKKNFPRQFFWFRHHRKGSWNNASKRSSVKNRCYLSKTGTGLHRKAGPYREGGQERTACGYKGACVNALTMPAPLRYENSARRVGMSCALVSSGFLSTSRAVCDSESQALESWGHTWPHRLSYTTRAHDVLCRKAQLHICFAVIFFFQIVLAWQDVLDLDSAIHSVSHSSGAVSLTNSVNSTIFEFLKSVMWAFSVDSHHA